MGHSYNFPNELFEEYLVRRDAIQQRLLDFKNVPEWAYFYELCYCICTPQSKARNAYKVQKILEERDFFNTPENVPNPADILRQPEHYIRFHNNKAMSLLKARDIYPEVLKILKSPAPDDEKRMWLFKNIRGFGMKEASHFMRNIGFDNMGILDRHILKHLVKCGVFTELPLIGSTKQYLVVEEAFKKFADEVGIPVDEIDLLFWSIEAGEILK
ncbi:MAG TPA: DNA lyase [Patescibacteria group bacterium]|nr:DNA lyase [Patescibacteria group bacterium]